MWGFAPVAQFRGGPSSGQNLLGACRSKGLVAAEHVTDRLGELAANLDRGDLPPALAAVPSRLAGERRLVARMAQRGVRGLNQSPAQVVGTVFAQRAAPVALTRLVDLGAEARVADELCRLSGID